VHPEDVAELLGEELERLAAAIEQAPALKAQAPVLELDPVPRLSVAFAKLERPRATAQVPARVLGPGGGTVLQQFEGVDLSQKRERKLILMLGCDDYDGQPPTAELLDADGAPLPREQWPKDLIRQGVIDGHRDYDRPFFCRAGLREYHTHPQHEDDPWDKHRESLRLHAVVLALLDELQGRWVLAS
jgi:Predicted metal binding domain